MSNHEQIEESDVKLLKNLTQILFFPSWRKLIGEDDFKGSYLNQAVYEVLRDNVILLPDLFLTGTDTTTGEPYIFISGAGAYYVQFRLSPGEIITDHREISGIILPLEVYEKAKDISGSLVNSDKLMMTEYIISIPFSLILTKQTTQMYLRGVIARNVLHPFKDCFNQFLKVCKNPQSLNLKEGYKILSGGLSMTTSAFRNQILTEKELDEYSKPIAGLKSFKPEAGELIQNLQLKEEKVKSSIFEKIRLIKKDFLETGYPKLLDWMP